MDGTTVDGTTVDGTTVDGTTVGGTTVGGTIDGVMNAVGMIVDAMIVGGTIVVVMIVDAMIVGVGVIEKSVTVRRGILGAVIVEMGVEMIVSEETVKEIATEEIVMNVIVLVGGTNAQMIVTVIVIVMRGEGGEGTIQDVISGDETHHLHVLKVC